MDQPSCCRLWVAQMHCDERRLQEHFERSNIPASRLFDLLESTLLLRRPWSLEQPLTPLRPETVVLPAELSRVPRASIVRDGRQHDEILHPFEVHQVRVSIDERDTHRRLPPFTFHLERAACDPGAI